MIRRFFLASHDCGDPWVPRECIYQDSLVAVPTGQRLFRVRVDPPFAGEMQGSDEPINEVLLGMVTDHWGLDDIGTWGFMVDLYAVRTSCPTKNPHVKDLTRLGMGTLHRSRSEACAQLGEEMGKTCDEASSSASRLEVFTAEKIFFLGEQDGFIEREFKNQIVSIFASIAGDIRVYLARVRYSHEGRERFNVALCIGTSWKVPQEVTRGVLSVFEGMFRKDEHLDVVILSDQQEQDLSLVCRPFLVR